MAETVPDGCKNHISVPDVCTYGVRLYVDLTLLSMEIILDTQILKKFRVERILVAFRDGALQAFFELFGAKFRFLKESCRKF